MIWLGRTTAADSEDQYVHRNIHTLFVPKGLFGIKVHLLKIRLKIGCTTQLMQSKIK